MSVQVMAPSSAAGSVTVAIHPLVIMNISEHWTRVRSQDKVQNPKVLGALIGTQKGRNLEIFNSFELQCDVGNDHDVIINREYYTTKEEQFKMVFKDLDFLGWYTTGDLAGTVDDMKVHRQVCEINESPIMMKLSPEVRTNELPISVFESVIDLVDGEACMQFVELKYTIATEEAERIGVDHIARLTSSGTSEQSSVAEQLSVQHSAVKMLHTRVRLILDYVQAVQAGELPRNHAILREINSLCHRLPAIDTAFFKEDFFTQCNDIMLMSYLASMTKGCDIMNTFIAKLNALFDRHGMGRRMRGLFY
ncbi:COP9 signalosome complex subunit 6-like [Corticium candelabrum]|uniref:COP9 signalosome complex subunit 6-like n=1 Tax=Corticium candelabrum TaxID=121492 RepID=UPI002E2563AD|nr:COP9 signalosome complex subunit 6-like [Corticium candelabrum]